MHDRTRDTTLYDHIYTNLQKYADRGLGCDVLERCRMIKIDESRNFYYFLLRHALMDVMLRVTVTIFLIAFGVSA